MSGRLQAPSPVDNDGRVCYSCGNSYPAAFRFCPIDSVDLDYLPQSIEELSKDFGKPKTKIWPIVAILSLFFLAITGWMTADQLNSKTAGGTPTSGELTVRTTPAGAAVFLDGSRVGISPVRLSDIPAGYHEVRAVCPGYSEGTAHVQILPSETQRLVWDLAPLPARKTMDKQRYLADLSLPSLESIFYISAERPI